MPSNNTELERNLWDAADELRANSRLRAADYSIPVLGLIFLKYADHKFAHATAQALASSFKRCDCTACSLFGQDLQDYQDFPVDSILFILPILSNILRSATFVDMS